MVRIEFTPLPEFPQGKTFDSDIRDTFKLRDLQFGCLGTGEILAPSIVSQLVKEYHDYLIDGYVYSKDGDRWIFRNLDRSSWMPALYEKAKERIQEAFTNTDLSPTQLIQTIEGIKHTEIQVDGCPQFFYVRPDIHNNRVHLDVIYYYSSEDKEQVLRICQIKDD